MGQFDICAHICVYLCMHDSVGVNIHVYHQPVYLLKAGYWLCWVLPTSTGAGAMTLTWRQSRKEGQRDVEESPWGQELHVSNSPTFKPAASLRQLRLAPQVLLPRLMLERRSLGAGDYLPIPTEVTRLMLSGMAIRHF